MSYVSRARHLLLKFSNTLLSKLLMTDSVFVEFEFFLLTACSPFLPISTYGYMMWKKAISRKTVFLFAVILIVISGVNVVLLQRLAEMAKMSPSLLDNQVFASELSVALYLLPALFAGIAVNMLSHTLIGHLVEAEKRFDREHS